MVPFSVKFHRFIRLMHAFRSTKPRSHGFSMDHSTTEWPTIHESWRNGVQYQTCHNLTCLLVSLPTHQGSNMWNWDIAMCTAYPTNWNIKMSYFLVAKMCLKQVLKVKTSIYHVKCPQMVGYVWISCRILLCVIQNHPSPLTPSNTHRCCQSIWRTRWTSQFIRSSHMPLCVICLLHVHTKTVDGFVFVCLLASCFVFCLFYILIVSLCLCDGVENWCCKPKKTAQLPLKVNGTVIDKVRTCMLLIVTHDWVFGGSLLVQLYFPYRWMNAFVLYSQSFAVIILSCWLNLQLFLKCWCWFENTRFYVVLDTTAHYFYNDQKLLCIVF